MRKREEQSPALREALWVSRCVGRPESSPLQPADITDLSHCLSVHHLEAGQPLTRAGSEPTAVYIVRDGCLELSVEGSMGRVIIQTLRPGSIDGDIQILLGRAMPYDTRAGAAATCLLLQRSDFERLVATHPHLSRRWLTSVSQRLAHSHSRLTSLLGEPLEVQVAQLLLDESVDNLVALPQVTVAALLGVRRPTVNRILRKFARNGLVRVSYGQVEILDAPRMAEIAGTGPRPSSRVL